MISNRKKMLKIKTQLIIVFYYKNNGTCIPVRIETGKAQKMHLIMLCEFFSGCYCITLYNYRYL